MTLVSPGGQKPGLPPTAAAAAMAWMRRLAAHPAVAEALAAEDISVSWARAVCAWTDLLPAECRAGADAILLAAAAGGAELADLARLAEEIRRRTARPDRDGDDGFTGRGLRLDLTFGQSGHLDHQLLAELAAELLRTRPGTRLPGTPWPGHAGTGQPGTGADDPVMARRLRAERAVRRLITTRAADLLSGPGGLASYLRTRLPDDLIASVSLPLDIGAVTGSSPTPDTQAAA
jgi:hypothetical protein